MPNRKTHPEFAEALKTASKNGVEIMVYDTDVKENSMRVSKPVKFVI